MWMLALMTLVNAILHQQGVQNKYRIELGIICWIAAGATPKGALVRNTAGARRIAAQRPLGTSE